MRSTARVGLELAIDSFTAGWSVFTRRSDGSQRGRRLRMNSGPVRVTTLVCAVSRDTQGTSRDDHG